MTGSRIQRRLLGLALFLILLVVFAFLGGRITRSFWRLDEADLPLPEVPPELPIDVGAWAALVDLPVEPGCDLEAVKDLALAALRGEARGGESAALAACRGALDGAQSWAMGTSGLKVPRPRDLEDLGTGEAVTRANGLGLGLLLRGRGGDGAALAAALRMGILLEQGGGSVVAFGVGANLQKLAMDELARGEVDPGPAALELVWGQHLSSGFPRAWAEECATMDSSFASLVGENLPSEVPLLWSERKTRSLYTALCRDEVERLRLPPEQRPPSPEQPWKGGLRFDNYAGRILMSTAAASSTSLESRGDALAARRARLARELAPPVDP